MILRNLPQGDGDITAQARLRSQQVIEAGVTAAFGDVEPDGKQFPRRVEQKRKVHRGQFVALFGQGFQCKQALAGMVAGFQQAAREFSVTFVFVDQRTERFGQHRDFTQAECLVKAQEFFGEVA